MTVVQKFNLLLESVKTFASSNTFELAEGVGKMHRSLPEFINTCYLHCFDTKLVETGKESL